MNKKHCYLIVLILLFVLSGCGKSDTTPPVDNKADKHVEVKDNSESETSNPVNDPILEVQAGDLKVSDAWFRTSQVGKPTELYVTMENHGSDDEALVDVLVSGVLSLRSSVDFYKGTASDENNLTMIEILGGETVELKPGEVMIYLDATDKDLTVGEIVNVDLHFVNAGDVSIDAEVR